MNWQDSWAWLAFGFLGNAAFFSRFLVQWIASEKAGDSVIPLAFWHLSLVGTFILLIYAVHKHDPVFTLAYLPNAFVYVRNLMLIKKNRKNETAPDRIGTLRAESSADVAEARS
ncbi:MAG TPA: lipid-A-disaccharide synthase N-terminal domain-containing protein [Myxococcota bacterium]|jgi:lipid-A-disaccharide synthase-like uncharacterized protein|nr:lipid-A-disaccharide synthase N-terminal domain-containing protein [Myxococcota bacterium]